MKHHLGIEVGRWIEANLRVTQGPLRGQPFKLRQWQRQFLRGAFDDGVSESALTMGRGGGKTTFIAAIACAALDGPLNEYRAGIDCIAYNHSQSKLTFRHVQAFLGDRLRSGRFKVLNSTNDTAIINLDTDLRFDALSTSPAGLHGRAPKLTIVDEPSQHLRTKRDAVIAALRTSSMKIEGARLIAIGTRSPDPEHYFEAMLFRGAADYAQAYYAPSDADPFAMSSWRAANPGLTSNPLHLADIRRQAKKARRDPNLLQQFRAYILNQGVADSIEQYVLNPDTWSELVTDLEPEGPYVLGLDLGESKSFTAASAYFSNGAMRVLACVGNQPGLYQRSLDDGAGTSYQAMYDAGELLLLGNREPDYGAFLTQIVKRWGLPARIVSDSYKANRLKDQLDLIRFPVVPFEERRFGPFDGSDDLGRMRNRCLTNRVHPPDSMLLYVGMRDARVERGNNGVEYLASGSQSGRRQNARDDIIAASVLAIGSMDRQPLEAVRPAFEYSF